MNVNMIRELAEQHKALKAFYTLCNRRDATLSISAPCPDSLALLSSSLAALIIPDIRKTLEARIRETEEAIQRQADG